MPTKCKDLHDYQRITVLYPDNEVVAICEHNTIRVTEEGNYVIDYDKLLDGIQRQLEEKFNQRRR